MTYLDTHVVEWLYAGETRLLSPRARKSIEEEEGLLASPMVTLELEFLKEIGRLTVGAEAVLEDLRGPIGIEVCHLAFEKVLAR